MKRLMRGASALFAVGLCVSGCTKVVEQPAAVQTPVYAATPPAPKKPVPKRTPFASSPFGQNPGLRARPEPTAAAATPDAAAAPVNTLNGDPKGPTREQIGGPLEAALPQLANCFDGTGVSGTVGLSFDADPGGKAANVRVRGAPPAAEACVRNAVSRVPLPSFEGRAVPIDYPMNIRASAPAPAPAPAAAQPPPPTGQFVQP